MPNGTVFRAKRSTTQMELCIPPGLGAWALVNLVRYFAVYTQVAQGVRRHWRLSPAQTVGRARRMGGGTRPPTYLSWRGPTCSSLAPPESSPSRAAQLAVHLRGSTLLDAAPRFPAKSRRARPPRDRHAPDGAPWSVRNVSCRTENGSRPNCGSHVTSNYAKGCPTSLSDTPIE